MASTRQTRLNSWKEIADYLDRDVTTVIRWEKEKGLPVHRLPGGKRHAVFASPAEIDAWMSNGGGQPGAGTGNPRAENGRFGQQGRDVLSGGSGLRITQADADRVADRRRESRATTSPMGQPVAATIRGYRIAYLVIGLLAIASPAVLVYLLTRPAAMPRVLRYTQITNDGRLKGGRLVTDGPRVYFTEEKPEGRVIAQAAAGGEVETISRTFKNPSIRYSI